MSAIKADALRDRFKITYQPTRADMPEQKAWHYLQFEPKLQGDKTIFSRARVVLNADTYFPGEIRLEQPNGNEMIWRFRNVNINVQLNAPEFLRPVPAGWDLKEGN